MNKKTVVDLFCGCGGLSYGFINADYEVLLGVDNEPKALETFKKNHKNSSVICGDISKIGKKEIKAITGKRKIDVLIGGPPCQGVSISGHRLKEDARNELFSSYLRILSELKPEAFVMENVPGLIGLFNGELKDILLEKFAEYGYEVSYKILRADHYGVPQTRKRVFFVGLKKGEKFEFPDVMTENPVTCFEALSDLPEYSVENADKYVSIASSEYQKLMRKGSKGIFNHEITNHKERTAQIISLVPDGGTYKSLPPEFRDTRKVNIAWTRLNSQKPSLTIDTGHRHHFHYEFNRIPTVRESARIQSFPDSFIFLGNKTSQYRQIGNAVSSINSTEDN